MFWKKLTWNIPIKLFHIYFIVEVNFIFIYFIMLSSQDQVQPQNLGKFLMRQSK